jgi:arylsulfate sulfotransferase
MGYRFGAFRRHETKASGHLFMKNLNVFAAAVLVLVGMLSACSNGNGVTPETATVTPGTADLFSGQTQQFTTNISNKPSDITWAVNSMAGGSLASGTIDASGLYTAPATQPTASVIVSATKASDSKITASASVNVVLSGSVAATANTQVAAYTIAPPVVAGVTVQFGTDPTYGLSTSQQQSAGAGAPLTVLVAGMKASTAYHLRASIQMPDGTTITDSDKTFTTGTLPKASLPVVSISTPNGLTPQPGVQMLDLVASNTPPALTLDLQGNVLWYYTPPDGSKGDLIDPIKQLPNGDFLVIWAPSSTYPLEVDTPLPDNTVNVLREIDLSGKTVRQIDIDTLNTKLAAAGNNYTALTFHHDMAILPNGHIVVLVNSLKTFTGLPHQGSNSIAVLGDALVELDNNMNPVWLWDEFDHLDIDREPYMFPDWTHSNAVLYSPTDGNLLVSIRHQNWLIKIDYEDGKGSGNILWHLGYQGDFTLLNGTDPKDWFFAEHGPSYTGSTTAGQYGLAVFDNGDDRDIAITCAETGMTPCPYSTAMVFQVDETAMTATVQQHDPTGDYSNFGGNAEVLANGDLEADSCYVTGPPSGTTTTEMTADQPSELVWSIHLTPGHAYRSFRMPSLYPGVQW